MFADIIFFIGIGNLIVSIILLIVLKVIFKDIEKRKRLTKFLYKILVFSVLVLIAWYAFVKISYKENKHYGELLISNRDTIIDFNNLIFDLPKDYQFVEQKQNDLEQFLFAKANSEEYMAMHSITKITKDLSKSLNQQADNLVNDAIIADTIFSYEQIPNKLFYNKQNLYIKVFNINLKTNTVITNNSKGVNCFYFFEFEDKYFMMSITIFREENNELCIETNNIIKSIFMKNRISQPS